MAAVREMRNCGADGPDEEENVKPSYTCRRLERLGGEEDHALLV